MSAELVRVVTTAQIEARSKAIMQTCDDVIFALLASSPLNMRAESRGKLSGDEGTKTMDLGDLAFRATPTTPAPRATRASSPGEDLFSRFIEHARFTTRFYIMFADAPVDAPDTTGISQLDAVGAYFEQLDALANRIGGEEGLSEPTRAQALESVSEAQLDFEAQLGTFHERILLDGGAAHLRGLVEALNFTLKEIAVWTPTLYVLDVDNEKAQSTRDVRTRIFQGRSRGQFRS